MDFEHAIGGMLELCSPLLKNHPLTVLLNELIHVSDCGQDYCERCWGSEQVLRKLIVSYGIFEEYS